MEPDPMGGVSMLEQMTGLPISMRTIKCGYAPKGAGFSTIELLNVAVSFYSNNCVGCPHRILVGVPNLKTGAEQIAKDDEEAARRRGHEAERKREEQSVRHRERERRVVNEPVPARDIVRLINQIDSDEGSARVGAELVAAFRGGKRYLTRPTIDVLVEAARAGLDEHVLEAVRVAAEQDAIRPDEGWLSRPRRSGERLLKRPANAGLCSCAQQRCFGTDEIEPDEPRHRGPMAWVRLIATMNLPIHRARASGRQYLSAGRSKSVGSGA